MTQSPSTGTLAVVGAGAMGRGIAQVFATHGWRVQLVDARPAAVSDAVAAIGQHLDRLVAKGSLSRDHATASMARLLPVDSLTALEPFDLAIEAVVEDAAVKRHVFEQLEAMARPQAILASNTSSLSIAAIAAACQQPERVIGLHFFNPAPLMKLVEVIPGARTTQAVTARATAIIQALGHHPVTVADRPGFLVNTLSRGYTGEALRILAEGVAEPSVVDHVMTRCLDFRMGPFEVLDLTGLDVSAAVMRQVYDGYWQEPRFQPTPGVAARVAAGLLGRKSGKGFYAYPPDPSSAAEPVAHALPLPPIWVEPGPWQLGATTLLRSLGAEVEAAARPSAAAIALVTPVGLDCTEAAARLTLCPARTVALDPLARWDRCRVVMAAPGADPAIGAAFANLLRRDGVPVCRIRDSAGFILQRLVVMMVQIACDAAQSRLAAPADIDRAAMLGLGYPQGPFAIARDLGITTVYDAAYRLFALTGEARYRPSPWLRRRARLSLPIDLDDSAD
ncbi:MAG: 3-hydroxyacyl-CoA dehydrogenase [Alphaproteobacteria bacterium]|nr:MAG: 3-hydroxyacyl-CoA dehydrogenase [Alphaproteobacteria bacterium]